MPRRTPKTEPLRSATGVPLTREVTFSFTADPTAEQARQFTMFAGAARFAFNYHLDRARANLDQRAAEKSYEIKDEDLTPPLDWSKFSFINAFNSWKNGTAPDSPILEDGTRGLAWRDEVSVDVFECASVDAAQALINFVSSRTGVRGGARVAFPKFKAKNKTTPAFRMRNRVPPQGPRRQAIRVAGPKAVWVRRFGEIRVHGCTRKLRRMLDSGRIHLYTAVITFVRGKWRIRLAGLAAEFHHQRRASAGRHARPAGLDRGVKSLAVVADDEGHVLHVLEGVKALQRAQVALRRAHQALSRAKPGSVGRRKAVQRLGKLHAKVVHKRAEAAHQLSFWAATTLIQLTIEDLNVSGMGRFRTLRKAVADAGMGDVERLLTYKSRWYGCNLVIADRWFPSSKTCSACGNVKSSLKLSDRTYRCEQCGHVLDRDINAAINLARWTTPLPLPNPALSTA